MTTDGNHDIPRAIHYATGEIENCTEEVTNGMGELATSPTERELGL